MRIRGMQPVIDREHLELPFADTSVFTEVPMSRNAMAHSSSG
jgi:hypothetical protein